MEKKGNTCKASWEVIGKVHGVSWKVALVAIGIFVALLIAYALWEQGNDHLGKGARYWDRNLSENICVHMFSSGNEQVYDKY